MASLLAKFTAKVAAVDAAVTTTKTGDDDGDDAELRASTVATTTTLDTKHSKVVASAPPLPDKVKEEAASEAAVVSKLESNLRESAKAAALQTWAVVSTIVSGGNPHHVANGKVVAGAAAPVAAAEPVKKQGAVDADVNSDVRGLNRPAVGLPPATAVPVMVPVAVPISAPVAPPPPAPRSKAKSRGDKLARNIGHYSKPRRTRKNAKPKKRKLAVAAAESKAAPILIDDTESDSEEETDGDKSDSDAESEADTKAEAFKTKADVVKANSKDSRPKKKKGQQPVKKARTVASEKKRKADEKKKAAAVAEQAPVPDASSSSSSSSTSSSSSSSRPRVKVTDPSEARFRIAEEEHKAAWVKRERQVKPRTTYYRSQMRDTATTFHIPASDVKSANTLANIFTRLLRVSGDMLSMAHTGLHALYNGSANRLGRFPAELAANTSVQLDMLSAEVSDTLRRLNKVKFGSDIKTYYNAPEEGDACVQPPPPSSSSSSVAVKKDSPSQPEAMAASTVQPVAMKQHGASLATSDPVTELAVWADAPTGLDTLATAAVDSASKTGLSVLDDEVDL